MTRLAERSGIALTTSSKLELEECKLIKKRMTWMCEISAVPAHVTVFHVHQESEIFTEDTSHTDTPLVSSSVHPHARLVLIFAALTQSKPPML